MLQRKKQEKDKKSSQNGIIIAVIIIAIVVITIITIVCGKNIYEKHKVVNNAESDLINIETAFNNANYKLAIERINDYRKRYSLETINYLPNNLCAETVYSKWKDKINTALTERITSCIDQLNENSTSEDWEKLESYIVELDECYPDGFNQIISSDELKHDLVKESTDDTLALVRIEISDLKWDEGDKENAIKIMQQVINNKTSYSNSITNNIKSAETRLAQMKRENVATDFEIIGGSSNVYIISQKNYGVICPYCGYRSGALGTGELYRNLSEHYAGETDYVSNGFLCASTFQGGCRQNSSYNITVKYK